MSPHALMTQTTPLIEVSHRGHITQLTLNAPSRLNVLSENMLHALIAALDSVASHEHCRVLVIAGAGKAFCAGHDLKQMAALPKSVTAYAQLFKLCSRVMLALQQLPQPVIAKVHGVAAAAGCQLVGACDLAVAASTAQFATSGINYGLFCATPSVSVLRNMPRKQAMQMLLTGDFVSAQQACDWGLINAVVPEADLHCAVETLCQSIVAKPPQAIRAGKQLIYQQAMMTEPAAYQLAAHMMAHEFGQSYAQEGAAAFIEKRSPLWSNNPTPLTTQ